MLGMEVEVQDVILTVLDILKISVHHKSNWPFQVQDAVCVWKEMSERMGEVLILISIKFNSKTLSD